MTDRVTPRGEPSGPPDKQVVHQLAIAVRTARVFEKDNAALSRTVSELLAALGRRMRSQDTLTVQVANASVFVDDTRVRFTAADYLDFRFLVTLFDQWGLGSITFRSGVGERELTDLVHALARTTERSLRALGGTIRHLPNVEVEPPLPGNVLPLGEDGALRAYAACVDVCRELTEAVRENRQIRTRRLRRVTQAVVDLVMQDEYALLALSTIKEFDDYLFHHSANVAILSVALGQRLGLSKGKLGELCLAAFLHDLGKTAVSKDILDKPGVLNDHEWEQMREHPIHSVHILLGQEHLSLSTLRAIIGGFEHHLNYDLTGYPKVKQKSSITTFGRVIAVTDRYDAMTTRRTYRTRNFTPYEGMRYLLMNSGNQFDPVLVKLFLELTGLYPPGTVLGLDTGEVAVVHRPPPAGVPVNRPIACILRGAGAGRLVDLAETGEDGAYLRSVRVVINPDNGGQLPALPPETLQAD